MRIPCSADYVDSAVPKLAMSSIAPFLYAALAASAAYLHIGLAARVASIDWH